MAAAPPPTPQTVAGLLRIVTADPGRPRLTWYGSDGERVELSGHVLDNWVAKTTNLLVEELDGGPGRTVLLDLPAHWRTIVWALACWRCGATVLLPGADAVGVGVSVAEHSPAGHDDPRAHRPADVVVTTDPAAHAPASALVVVSLPALSRRVDGTLPGGAIDAAAAVMTYPDHLGWVPETDLATPALVTGASTLRFGDLLPAARGRATGMSRRSRVAIDLRAPGRSLEDMLLAALAILAVDGSTVLVDRPEVPDALITAEKVTERV